MKYRVIHCQQELILYDWKYVVSGPNMIHDEYSFSFELEHFHEMAYIHHVSNTPRLKQWDHNNVIMFQRQSQSQRVFTSNHFYGLSNLLEVINICMNQIYTNMRIILIPSLCHYHHITISEILDPRVKDAFSSFMHSTSAATLISMCPEVFFYSEYGTFLQAASVCNQVFGVGEGGCPAVHLSHNIHCNTCTNEVSSSLDCTVIIS